MDRKVMAGEVIGCKVMAGEVMDRKVMAGEVIGCKVMDRQIEKYQSVRDVEI